MMQALVAVSLVVLLALTLAVSLSPVEFGTSELKDYLQRHAAAEIGAENLVTAVYLGYRAFDTLGETVVLVLSVTGVLSLLRGRN
jgi:multicomponent Na+:H+ antiporter subunit B